jgi:hypothetical protein
LPLYLLLVTFLHWTPLTPVPLRNLHLSCWLHAAAIFSLTTGNNNNNNNNNNNDDNDDDDDDDNPIMTRDTLLIFRV